MSAVQQPDLFSVPMFPRARRSDPKSSHGAAAQADKFGGHQAQQTLAAVRLWPLSTSHELAEAARMDRYAVARRLPELAATGLVRRIEPTEHTEPCRVSGKRVCRWEAVFISPRSAP